MGDPCDLQEVIQKHGYQKNDAERRENHSDRSRNRSRKSFLFITYICGTVDGDRSGRGFRDHRDVHHFIVRDPLLLLHTGIFNQGDHGITAAEGEKPNLCERQKEIRQRDQAKYP